VLATVATSLLFTATSVGAKALPPPGSVPGEYVAVAGGSLGPGLGNGGPANSAMLNYPSGIAVDQNGNTYIADTDDNMVRKVAPNGVISDFAGIGVAGYYGDGGPAYNAELDHPEGVGVDANGNVYIADTGNNVVREVNAAGTITTFAGNGTAGYSGDNGAPSLAELNRPTGVSVAPNGWVAISDTNNSVIRIVQWHLILLGRPRLQPHFTLPLVPIISTYAGIGLPEGDYGDGGPATSAGLNYPEAVAFDASGNLDIADTGNSAIRQVNLSTGKISTLFYSPYPTGVATDGSGHVYVPDGTDNKVFSWKPGGSLTTIIGTGVEGNSGVGGKATNAQLDYPLGIATDQYSDVFITDNGNNLARELVVARAPDWIFDTPPLVTTDGALYAYPFVAGCVPKCTFSLVGAPAWLHIAAATGLVGGTVPAATANFTYSVKATNTIGTSTVGPFLVTIPVVTSHLGAVGPVQAVVGPDHNIWFTNRTASTIGRLTPAGALRIFTSPLIKNPFGIAVGPDHNMWFTNSGGTSVGRITPTGVVNAYSAPWIKSPFGIAAGPTGSNALYFTNNTGNSIGKVTIAGGLAHVASPLILGPDGITLGPDGAMWFCNNAGNSIGRITTAGAVTKYTSPTVINPAFVVVGPDKNLWFTNAGNNTIGKITPTGSPITTYGGVGVSDPQGITVGPDHQMWFTNFTNQTIGHITTTGVVANLPEPGLLGPVTPILGPDNHVWVVNYLGSSIARLNTPTSTTQYGDTAAPIGIVKGPDGAMWFTSSISNAVGRIDTAGNVKTFRMAGMSGPLGIASGPDGNLWFTAHTSNLIGRVTPAGVITLFGGVGISGPTGIEAGSDGRLWFTNSSNNTIGAITTAGVVSNYGGLGISNPLNIARGSDGQMWFTNNGNNSIGSISIGGFVQNYTGIGISAPYGIAAAPDGNLWFTDAGNNTVGRITTGGAVAVVGGPTISAPRDIAVGVDGALWFTNSGNNSIGRITTVGVQNNYPSPLISGPIGIAAGPDNALWFANTGNSTIGHITG
jgi:streptogramin lyase